MKEDILEQLVDDYLKSKGYFTVHNVKFKPPISDTEYIANDDRVDSDVDVVGFNPKLDGTDRVWVVSCKSWQKGFSPKSKISKIEKDIVESRSARGLKGRDTWKSFREIAKRKWADSLIAKVEELTGCKEFTYVTAVTRLTGNDRSIWEQYPLFKKNLRNNPIRILTLQDMLSELYQNTSQSIAPSQVGRLLQVIRASGWKPQ